MTQVKPEYIEKIKTIQKEYESEGFIIVGCLVQLHGEMRKRGVI